MSDSITETDKVYDDYVKYYNDSGKTIGGRISVLAEFLIIEQTVKDRTARLREPIKKAYISFKPILERITERISDKNYAEFDIELLEKKLTHEVKSFNSIAHVVGNKFTLDDLTSLKSKLDELFDDYDMEKLEFKFAIDTIKEFLIKYRQTLNHASALWTLNLKIVDDYYPPKLHFYNELPEDEKSKLTSNGNNLGAPLREEVPQAEIEEIVINCTVDKKNKRFFHQKGSNKGEPNINQIALHIAETNPNMVNGYGNSPDQGVAFKTIKRRVERALKNDRT